MYAHAHGTCPAAHAASGEILSLPLHLRLSRTDVDTVAELLIRHAA
jgi:dTDP-4-amino-4,6-dideoxygalactose transaminase